VNFLTFGLTNIFISSNRGSENLSGQGRPAVPPAGASPNPRVRGPPGPPLGLTYLLANKLILKLVQTADSKCTNIPETNQFEFNLGEERAGGGKVRGGKGVEKGRKGGKGKGLGKVQGSELQEGE
jgi:hypothetical protein